jgi:hypothetical protein
MKIFHALLITLLLAGCAASPEKLDTIAKKESMFMQSATEALSNFDRFVLEELSYSEAIADKPEKVEQVIELNKRFQTQIGPLVAEWNTKSAGNGGRTLEIKPHVQQLRVVSGGARFWVGAFAGKSEIDINMKLIEKETGKIIAQPRYTQDTDPLGGAWSIGATDRNLLDYIAHIARQYLVDQYE